VGGNIGKVMVMLLGPVLALLLPRAAVDPLVVPLLPLQLLWLNLLTDGLLGVGLGVEPAEKNVMRRPPVASNASIFGDGLLGQMIRIGGLIGVIALGIGLYEWSIGNENWQTMMFTTLTFCQVWQALGIRSGNDSLFQSGLNSNKPLLLLAILVIALQLAAVYVPVFQTFLGTRPLVVTDALMCALLSSLVFVMAETEKATRRRLYRAREDDTHSPPTMAVLA